MSWESSAASNAFSKHQQKEGKWGHPGLHQRALELHKPWWRSASWSRLQPLPARTPQCTAPQLGLGAGMKQPSATGWTRLVPSSQCGELPRFWARWG